MSKLFKLVKEEFSPIDKERQGTYSCLSPFTFKKRTITQITITDHPGQKKGREGITHELVLNIFQSKINGGQRLKPLPDSYLGGRDVFRLEVVYNHQPYRLFFGFKDHTINHLWIRNIHPID